MNLSTKIMLLLSFVAFKTNHSNKSATIRPEPLFWPLCVYLLHIPFSHNLHIMNPLLHGKDMLLREVAIYLRYKLLHLIYLRLLVIIRYINNIFSLTYNFGYKNVFITFIQYSLLSEPEADVSPPNPLHKLKPRSFVVFCLLDYPVPRSSL